MLGSLVLFVFGVFFFVYGFMAILVLAAWLVDRQSSDYGWEDSGVVNGWVCWVDCRYIPLSGDMDEPGVFTIIAAFPIFTPLFEGLLILVSLTERHEYHNSWTIP